jgi:hypothetical protein
MTAITSWIVSKWPFDMIKFLKYYTIIMHDDGTNLDMYEAYCGTDNIWAATECISNIVPSNSTVVPLNWDFADFDWFYGMAFAYTINGVVATKCYQRSPGVASGVAALTTLPSDACPTFITCCNFRGQPILGGIISSNATWTQLGLASVCWGAIGQWEFRPQNNRTAGFIRMPWSDWDQGMVLKVAELGGRVVVYGNGGSCSLVPYAKEHAVGFGLDDKVMGPGIQSGFHFAGDKDKHLIVGNDNNLYITNETGDFGKALGFKKVGYKEYITEMLEENNDYAEGTPLCLSYDPLRRRFYISGIHSSYCLTELGLYKCHQSTTGIGRYRGVKLAGFVVDNQDYEARLMSDCLDMRLRGKKTIETIEFGLDSGSNAYGGIDSKDSYDYNKMFRSGTFKPIGPNGVVYPGVTTSDFKIKFKALDYRDGIKLDYINCKWKLSDKRSVRGLYNANKAQSGAAE